MDKRRIAGMAGVAVLSASAVAGVALGREPAAVEPITVSASTSSAVDGSVAGLRDSASQSSTPGKQVGRRAAERLAVLEVGGGTVLRSELESDDGTSYWEVHIERGAVRYEVDVARTKGEILEIDVADDDDVAAASQPSPEPTVSRRRAHVIALETTGGGDVRLSHLDAEDGALEWELVVVDKAGRWVELTIDAQTGDVLDVDVEDDRD